MRQYVNMYCDENVVQRQTIEKGKLMNPLYENQD